MSHIEVVRELPRRLRRAYLRPDERALAAVHKVFGVSVKDVLEESRYAFITKPRHIAVAVAYVLMPKRSMERVGARFGRHHTTALYSICEVSDALKRADPKWVPQIEEVCEIVGIEKAVLLREKTNDARKVRKNKKRQRR